jgi:hypothetical protein
MRVKRLLSRVFSNEERFVEHPTAYNNEPLIKLLRILHHCPFSWRKWLLNICRIQANPLVNEHVHYLKVEPAIISFSYGKGSITISTEEVAQLSLNIIDSSLSLSILSYFVRAESTAFPEQFQAIREERIYKEIGAALQYSSTQSYAQNLDYKWLNIDGKSNQGFTYDMFNRGLRRLRSDFSRHHTNLLIPYYNERKNVGYTTQYLYHASRNDEENTSRDVTTADLIRHYMRTGVQVVALWSLRAC